MQRTTHRVVLATSVLALAAGLTACGGSGSTSTSATSSSSSPSAVAADATLAAMVPAAIKSDGTITVGTDSTYAPNEFLDTDGKTVIGMDVDLFDAVAAKLGLKTQWQPADFGTLVAAVTTSGKYEIGVSSFTINKDRMKQADMVSYFSAGTLWATGAGNPQKVDPDNACGKKVAVQKSTVQVDDVTARSKKCTDAGKPAIAIDQYAGQDQATSSVVSGKDDAMLADSPVTAYAVKQTSGKLEVLGDIYDSAPYGYVIKKGEGDFGKALVGALQALQKDGTYTAILTKWGVQQGAITDFAVNPAVSS